MPSSLCYSSYISQTHSCTSHCTPMSNILASCAGYTGGEKWGSLGEDYFCKSTLFQVTWPFTFPSLQPGSFTLQGLLVSCAPLGGPIAMIRDSSFVSDIATGERDILYQFNKRMSIFSAAGKLLSQFEVPYSNIKAIQWDHNDNIACILEDGSVIFYNTQGNTVLNVDLGTECQENSIVDVSTFPHGVIARAAGTTRLFYLSFSTSIVHRYPDLKLTPVSLAVVPFHAKDEEVDIDSVPDVIVACPDGKLLKVTEHAISSVDLGTGSITKIGTSVCGSFITLYSASGTVFATTRELQRLYFRFDAQSQTPPTYFACITNKFLSSCCEETTCLQSSLSATALHTPTALCVWNQKAGGAVVLLLQGQQYLSYSFSTHVIVTADVDGARIITDEQCDFLQPLPTPLRAVLEPRYATLPSLLVEEAMPEPGALLLAAHRHYKDTSLATMPMATPTTPSAHSATHSATLCAADVEPYISRLKDDGVLVLAIEQVMAAAAHEVDPGMRATLLHACSFGRLCVDVEQDISPDDFSSLCRDLRVVEQLCTQQYGFPFSPFLFKFTDPDHLLRRLVAREEHLLAYRIAKYLRTNPEQIVEDYCVRKIVNSPRTMKDQELCHLIVEKYKSAPGLTFARIATCAADNMRPQLAVMLLAYEPRASTQVSLLLSLGEWLLALDAAVASLDSDLVAVALETCEKHMSTLEFDRAVSDRAFAENVYVSLLRSRGDWDTLKLHYGRLERVQDGAMALIHQAYECDTLRDRQAKLSTAKAVLEGERGHHLGVLLTEQLELLAQEDKLETEFREPFLDMSAREVVENLLKMHQDVKVNKFKNTLKMSDAHFEYIEVHTLASMRAFDALSKKAAASRRGPAIGYEPYIEACVKNNNKVEASKYVALLSDTAEQLEWYCTLAQWSKAIDVAVREKDVEALELIRARCRNADVQATVDNAIRELR